MEKSSIVLEVRLPAFSLCRSIFGGRGVFWISHNEYVKLIGDRLTRITNSLILCFNSDFVTYQKRKYMIVVVVVVVVVVACYHFNFRIGFRFFYIDCYIDIEIIFIKGLFFMWSNSHIQV
uniref:Uncharacterized protein n=1 Tax=Cannabis sativa TaxID=3483 RepID=A0A803R855_CANSA